MRWPFLVDFGFFCVNTTALALTWARTGLTNAVGDVSDPGIALFHISVVSRLVLVPISDYYGWQQRPDAQKYLKIAAFVTGLQIVLAAYQIAAWLSEHAARVGFAALFDDPLVQSTLFGGLPVAGRAVYNAIFYYWAIAQARTSPGTR
jgi:hypothetical protein